MPVALITIHAYRSWTEDNPRGYVQRGTPGVQQPSVRLAKHRASIARQPPVVFDRGQAMMLIDTARELCGRFEWRLHAMSTTPTHLHLLISWKRDDVVVRQLSTLLKRKLGSHLTQQKNAAAGDAEPALGNRWFSRGVHETYIRDRQHFDHLCSVYLPRHVLQNGVFWCEGDRCATGAE